ncbi:MAG: type II CAAX prenyl endopeptidase Rce1 family protein [Rhodothermales bacterium]
MKEQLIGWFLLMPDTPSTDNHATLADPWEHIASIPLNGLLERNRFGPLLTAFFALFVGFVLFQGISTVVTLVLLMLGGVDLARLSEDLATVLEQQAGAILTANSIGQIFGLALVAYVAARLHSQRPWAFVRMRRPDVALLILGVIGLFALMPAVQWIGTINQSMPLPDFLRELEESQMALIEKILLGNRSVVFSLAMLAITPALCEELLFRGYAQRQLERGWGSKAGILASGLFFGLYHLRLTQVLPLSLLGIYLAYLAWRTGSLWVPIVVHFANNAFAIATSAYVQNRPDLDIADIEQIEIPWYIAQVGLVFFGLIVYAMHRRAQDLLARQPAPSPPEQQPIL